MKQAGPAREHAADSGGDSPGGRTEGVAGSADPNTRSLLWEA